MTVTALDIEGREAWDAWRAHREHAALAPHGIASLTGTHWLAEKPRDILGLARPWRTDGRVATDGEITVTPDGRVAHGDVELGVTSRDGSLGLRVFDPNAVTRREIRGIGAFDPDPAWAVEGVVEPADGATLTIDRIDGTQYEAAVAGVVRFEVAAHKASLVALDRPDGGLHIVFADTTNGETTKQFRFLLVTAPDEDGRVILDFNRAFLPPCAFTDFYLCPIPPAQNRLPFDVTAGETVLLPA